MCSWFVFHTTPASCFSFSHVTTQKVVIGWRTGTAAVGWAGPKGRLTQDINILPFSQKNQTTFHFEREIKPWKTLYFKIRNLLAGITSVLPVSLPHFRLGSEKKPMK